MKKYIFMAVAAIAALSSCSSDNDPIMGETEKQALTFTASMEGSATRATYNSTEKCASWEVNDQISINGKTYNAQSAGLTTTFKAATAGQEAEGSNYNAYFACTYDGTTATLPAEITETWADGKFNMPMYATSTTTDLQFHNLCGVLKIIVKSDQIAAVKAIKVSSATKAVSGAFTVSSDAAVLSDASTVANTLTITYTEAVPTTAEGKVFYVAVPAQTYQELKIRLDADGNGFTKSMTTKNATNITVERNKIYPIVFTENHEYVDLDLNVKWATCNIGASAPEDYGYFFAWGETEGFGHNTNDRKGFEWAGYTLCDGTSDHLTKYCQEAWRGPVDGKTTLDPEDDAAHVYWGGTWRMPTQAEQDELRTNCTWTWCTQNGVNGYKVTSNKNGNSIFLPAAGTRHYNYLSNEGTKGVYWSSSLSSSLSAHNLFLNENHVESNANARCNGYSVRAVCH